MMCKSWQISSEGLRSDDLLIVCFSPVLDLGVSAATRQKCAAFINILIHRSDAKQKVFVILLFSWRQNIHFLQQWLKKCSLLIWQLSLSVFLPEGSDE